MKDFLKVLLEQDNESLLYSLIVLLFIGFLLAAVPLKIMGYLTAVSWSFIGIGYASVFVAFLIPVLMILFFMWTDRE